MSLSGVRIRSPKFSQLLLHDVTRDAILCKIFRHNNKCCNTCGKKKIYWKLLDLLACFGDDSKEKE